MTTGGFEPFQLDAEMGGQGVVVSAHRDHLGDLWGLASELLGIQHGALHTISTAEAAPSTERLTVLMGAVHAQSLFLAAYMQLARGQLDVFQYLRRPLFDVMTFVRRVTADPDFAERTWESRRTHLASDARKDLIPDAELDEQIKQYADGLQRFAHLSFTHLASVFAIDSATDSEIDGNVPMSFGTGVANPELVTRHWVGCLRDHALVVMALTNYASAAIPDEVTERLRALALVLAQPTDHEVS